MRMQGFTLVEVLVALFVLAVGVVGAGATQLTAQRTHQQAALGSEAAHIAASLAARMRVNGVIAGLPDSANPYLMLSYDAADGPPDEPQLCLGDVSCTPAQLAQFDLYEIRQAAHAQLPRARVEVCRDATPWDSAIQGYRWSCDDDPAALPVVKLGWQGTGDAPGYVAVLR